MSYDMGGSVGTVPPSHTREPGNQTMADYSIPELKGNPSADSGNTDFNIVSAARNGVCSVYRAAPYVLTYPDDTTGPFDSINDAYRKFLDNLCNDGNLPPLDPGTPGGKCAIAYVVQHRLTFTPFGGSLQTRDGQVTVTGPIGGVSRRTRPDDSSQWQWGFTFNGGAEFFPMGAFPKGSPEANSTSAFVRSVTAVNPALDICGSRPPQFQPSTPTGNPFSPNIEYRDRGSPVTVKVNIPPIIIPPGAIQVKPQITVKVGPNKITFDLSGGKLSFEPEITIPVTIGRGPNGENPNTPIPISPGIDGELLADRFDRLEDLLKDLEDCACSDSDLSTLVATPGTEANSQCVSISIGRNKFCAIAITQRPKNEKSQDGVNAPDVLYAGWAWFKTGDYLFTRSPVDCEGKIFRNPGNASAFCYTLYAGYKGVPIILDKPLPAP